MPQWIQDLTVAQVILFLGAVSAAAAGIWKVGRPALRALRRVADLADVVVGTPAKVDASGAQEEPARPGMVARLTSLEEAKRAQNALLETIRSQVQNSHSTNLRDDLDTHGIRLDDLAAQVTDIVTKLDEHIRIAIESDRRQDETAEQVNKLAARWAADQN
jgi:hypothetical protein